MESTMQQPAVFIRHCLSGICLRSALSPRGHDTPPAPQLILRSLGYQPLIRPASTPPCATVPAPRPQTRGRQTTASTWGQVSTASTPGATGPIRPLRQSNDSGALCCRRRCAGMDSPTTSANGGTIRFMEPPSRVPMIFQSRREDDKDLRQGLPAG